jgi:general secretion pathway protein I
MKKVGERGFTLLEVLVATVIMAIAISGVLGALSTSVRNASRLTDRDRASMLARRKMEELLIEKRLPRHIILEGLYDPVTTNGLPSGWKARVTPFEVPPNPAPGTKMLERLEVQVWWQVAGRTMTFDTEGFRRTVLTPQDVAGGGLLPQ